MFNASILELENQIHYHREHQELAEQELDRLKMVSAFAEDATDKVSEALEHIDEKYISVFKEHLLLLFTAEALVKEEVAPQEIIEEVEEKLPTEVRRTEVPKKSYYELTGRPDLRPPTYEDLAPNISYSSDGRAYVGFNEYSEAEKFRDSISEPSMIDDAVIMNGFKHEVKFHCSKEYIEELLTQDVKEGKPVGLEKIDGEIIYNHSDSIAYLAFSAKGRADNYGSYLTRILDIADKYTVSNKPYFVDSKYELRLEGVNFEDALHLQSFNLKKDYDHPDHREIREVWRTTRQREVEPACKPSPKLVPLNEVKLGDIIYLNSINNQYKVLQKVELDGIPHFEVICVFNSERPSLVSAVSYLKECYKVPTEEIQIDPQFKEEVLTKDVQIYVPVPQERKETTLKKSEELSEADFPASPYKSIELSELEFGDIITSTPYAKSAYEVIGVNTEYATAICLYHQALPGRVGEQYTFANPYLVEKATEKVVVATQFHSVERAVA